MVITNMYTKLSPVHESSLGCELHALLIGWLESRVQSLPDVRGVNARLWTPAVLRPIKPILQGRRQKDPMYGNRRSFVSNLDISITSS